MQDNNAIYDFSDEFEYSANEDELLLSKKRKKRAKVKNFDGKKPRFESGIRKELMDIFLTCGVVSFDGFEMWKDKHQKKMYSKGIKTLITEGYVEEIRVGNKKTYRLKNEPEYAEIYFDRYPTKKREYYEEIGKQFAYDIGRSATGQPARAKKISEIIMMMYNIGVGVTYNTKAIVTRDEEIPNIGSYYYIAPEVKKESDYEVKEIIEGGESKAIASSFMGMLISEGGDYIVYNTDNERMRWNEVQESQVRYYCGDFLRKNKEGVKVVKMLDEAIIYYKKEEIIEDVYEDKKAPGGKSISVTNEAYKRVYYLPYTNEGKLMTKIMTVSGWKEKLKKMCLGKYDIRTERIDVDCDGVERDENGKITTYFFLYCIPDIKRLRKFMNTAEINGSIEEEGRREKKEYVVMCFRHQKDFVDSVKNRYVRVKSAELNEEKLRIVEEM